MASRTIDGLREFFAIIWVFILIGFCVTCFAVWMMFAIPISLIGELISNIRRDINDRKAHNKSR
jgi:hypothetical protein